MKIYTLDDILKTEHLGNEKYVRVEEIERLWKEKEWLLHDNAQSEYWCSGRTTLEKCRERIITRLQQALKEE